MTGTWLEIPLRRPLVAGLIWPLAANVFEAHAPSMPPAHCSSVSHLCEDARDNFAICLDQTTRALGPGEAENYASALGHKWEFGPASLAITAYPADMQQARQPKPAHLRDPRLIAGCHINIDTGYFPTVSAAERADIFALRWSIMPATACSALSRNRAPQRRFKISFQVEKNPLESGF